MWISHHRWRQDGNRCPHGRVQWDDVQLHYNGNISIFKQCYLPYLVWQISLVPSCQFECVHTHTHTPASIHTTCQWVMHVSSTSHTFCMIHTWNKVPTRNHVKWDNNARMWKVWSMRTHKRHANCGSQTPTQIIKQDWYPHGVYEGKTSTTLILFSCRTWFQFGRHANSQNKRFPMLIHKRPLHDFKD
jgi:hypothetical protein